jgi:hypothetical protein
MPLLRSHSAITSRTLTGSATDAISGRDDAIVFTDPEFLTSACHESGLPVTRSGCPRCGAAWQHLTLADRTRCALEELALDDVEGDAFAGELDGVRVARLMQREAPRLALEIALPLRVASAPAS